MSIYEFIISVFLIIEQFYSAIVIQPLRSRGFPPALSDIEILTIQIVGEFLGLDSDKNIWFYFKKALLHKDWKCKAPLIELNLRRNLGKWST